MGVDGCGLILSGCGIAVCVCIGMTAMTKQVGARQEDLTNPSHANILGDELEQVLWRGCGS